MWLPQLDIISDVYCNGAVSDELVEAYAVRYANVIRTLLPVLRDVRAYRFPLGKQELRDANAAMTRVLRRIGELLGGVGEEVVDVRLVSATHRDLTALVRNSEFRQDRFLTAVDWGGMDTLRLAYVVRAISPGVFHHPAASVEDMYRPDFRAQSDAGQVVIAE